MISGKTAKNGTPTIAIQNLRFANILKYTLARKELKSKDKSFVFMHITIIQYRTNESMETRIIIQLKKVTSMNSFKVITFRIHEKAIDELNHMISVLPDESFGPLNPTAVHI